MATPPANDEELEREIELRTMEALAQEAAAAKKKSDEAKQSKATTKAPKVVVTLTDSDEDAPQVAASSGQTHNLRSRAALHKN